MMTAEISNLATASGISTIELKALISESDRSLVLCAINDKLNQLKIAWAKENANSSNPGRDAFYMNCMNETVSSISNQIKSINEPVDTVDRQLAAFQYRKFASEQSPSSIEFDDESSSSLDENEEFEFDDEEILDKNAYDMVKELRLKSREVASRVISVREEALERALGLTSTSISELMRIHGFSSELEVNDETVMNDLRHDPANYSRMMESLHVALHNLTSSMANIDSSLVEKLEFLKETIGTIDFSVQKYQRASQGDDNAFSQIERAIISASNDLHEAKDTGVEQKLDTSTLDPDSKLARLLAGVY